MNITPQNVDAFLDAGKLYIHLPGPNSFWRLKRKHGTKRDKDTFKIDCRAGSLSFCITPETMSPVYHVDDVPRSRILMG